MPGGSPGRTRAAGSRSSKRRPAPIQRRSAGFPSHQRRRWCPANGMATHRIRHHTTLTGGARLSRHPSCVHGCGSARAKCRPGSNSSAPPPSPPLHNTSPARARPSPRRLRSLQGEFRRPPRAAPAAASSVALRAIILGGCLQDLATTPRIYDSCLASLLLPSSVGAASQCPYSPPHAGSGGRALLGLPSSDTCCNRLLDAGKYETLDIGEEPPADEFALAYDPCQVRMESEILLLDLFSC